MLILDPTEASSTSKLTPEAIAEAFICKNLEAETGADMLITSLEIKIPDAGNVVGKLLLRKHLAAGAWLVQRKGTDILNFITDHDQILARMLKWTTMPWLLTIGKYDEKDGKLLINGRKAGGEQGWYYSSYLGSLTAWQRRGGYVANIARDDLFIEWYKSALREIQATDPKLVAPRKPSQQILMAEGEGSDAYTRNAAITALSTINGVSLQKATAIVDYCGTLANSIVFLADPEHLKIKSSDDKFPKGIGNAVFANSAYWLGLEAGGMGDEQWRDVMYIVRRYVNESKNADIVNTTPF